MNENDRKTKLANAKLYLVADTTGNAENDSQLLTEAVAGGVDLVQLRCKTLPLNELRQVAKQWLATCTKLECLFILNDYVALAAELNADGAHVGQDDMSVQDARRLLAPTQLLGLSTHTPQQIEAAKEVDYIGVGPVNATPTKPGRSAVGLELVRHASLTCKLPFFAIGGINVNNVADVAAAGGNRIATVRAVTESKDPRAAATELKAHLR